MMNGSDQDLGPHKNLIKLNIGFPKIPFFALWQINGLDFFYNFLMIPDESSCQNLSPTCFWPSKDDERLRLCKWGPRTPQMVTY